MSSTYASASNESEGRPRAPRRPRTRRHVSARSLPTTTTRRSMTAVPGRDRPTGLMALVQATAHPPTARRCTAHPPWACRRAARPLRLPVAPCGSPARESSRRRRAGSSRPTARTGARRVRPAAGAPPSTGRIASRDGRRCSASSSCSSRSPRRRLPMCPLGRAADLPRRSRPDSAPRACAGHLARCALASRRPR